MSGTPSQVTPERIMQFAFGFAPPLILEAALRHRVFDILDSGPKTVEQVSAESGASVRGLRAIMNALVALEFLAKDSQQRYSLLPEAAAFLVSTKPGYHGGFFQHTSAQLIPNWLHLEEIVRTGKPVRSVNQESQGAPFFQEFVEAIFPLSYPVAQTLGKALGVPQAQQPIHVLDLAAGSGVWGIALAQQSPQVRVTAVDWADVIPVTRRMAARFGLEDRFRFIAGDLQEVDFGTGYQVATLGHILHSEGEANSRALLRKVYEALAPGGTIAIHEMVANEEHSGPPFAMIFAVNMLVNTEEGDTYSFGEMSRWLQEAGFVSPRTVEAPSHSPLILAEKA
ncbi:MAG TPA: class I SAM-dependent methyltransferase [Chthonomonadaceae bacterium]|nr:class I SAM-dependent methyltransferase [Chthonomonadaceae bacterium]